jgi:tRNA threonylcarbamoyladenosine modification (KEOPS) complex  Pcc1 subunit
MFIDTVIKLQFPTPKERDIFYQSFLPEFSDLPMKRSEWQIEVPSQEFGDLSIHIKSVDATAFRATINSLIQFAHIVEKTIAIADQY